MISRYFVTIPTWLLRSYCDIPFHKYNCYIQNNLLFQAYEEKREINTPITMPGQRSRTLLLKPGKQHQHHHQREWHRLCPCCTSSSSRVQGTAVVWSMDLLYITEVRVVCYPCRPIRKNRLKHNTLNVLV